MTLVEQIQRQISQLPPEKQSEVLDFVTFLRGQFEKPVQPARRALNKHPAFGLWKGRGIEAVPYQQNLRSEWDERG
jgi:hypothetical protein